MDLFDVLNLIGGLSLFLFGMTLMGQALERSLLLIGIRLCIFLYISYDLHEKILDRVRVCCDGRRSKQLQILRSIFCCD